VTLRDRAIRLFKSGTKNIKPQQIRTLHNFTVVSPTAATNDSDDDQEVPMDNSEEVHSNDLRQGWALSELNTNTRF
jgi:hypothetical protein